MIQKTHEQGLSSLGGGLNLAFDTVDAGSSSCRAYGAPCARYGDRGSELSQGCDAIGVRELHLHLIADTFRPACKRCLTNREIVTLSEQVVDARVVASLIDGDFLPLAPHPPGQPIRADEVGSICAADSGQAIAVLGEGEGA